MLIIVLLAQIVLCWSGKPLDYTPLLKYLDDDIVRDLSDPIEGRGPFLVEYIEKYNDILGDARDMIDQNVYEAYIKAIELQKIGGPQFLKTKIDKELLKRVYNWTEDNFTNLQKLFELTKTAWKEIESQFKSAEATFKKIHEAEAKEKAEQVEREQKRVEELRKTEEEISKRITVNMGTTKPEE